MIYININMIYNQYYRIIKYKKIIVIKIIIILTTVNNAMREKFFYIGWLRRINLL